MTIIFSIILFLIFFQDIKLKGINTDILSYADEIFIVILIILSFYTILKKKKVYREQILFISLTILFIIFGLLSFIINSSQLGSIKDLIFSAFLASKFFIVIISFSVIDFKFDLKKTIIKSIFVVEKIAILIGIFNFFFPNLYFQFFSFAEQYTRFGFESITSCFNHPSTFGWFMLLCTYLHFTKYNYENDSKDGLKAIISLIFALISFRTKIIIGIIISYFIYEFVIQRKNINKYLKKIVCGIIIISVLTFTFKNVLEYTYSVYIKSEHGTTARNALTTTGKKIMNDYFPLGVGFGKFGTWYAEKNYSEYYYIYKINNIYGLSKEVSKYSTDTFWPAIMGETGFLGLITYILYLFYLIRILLKYNKLNISDKNNKIFYVTSLLLLFHLIVESTGEASFNFSPKNIIVGMFVGISLKDYFNYRNRNIKTKGSIL